jgi:plasmid stabilization system protein ParE
MVANKLRADHREDHTKLGIKRRKDLLFYVADPCLIAFRREDHGNVMIIRVLHGKRDVGGILR